MPKELIYSNKGNASLISRRAERGLLKKIAHGIYTSDLATPLESQVAENILDILEYLGVKGAFAYRSALEYPKFKAGEDVIITGERKREVNLPGFTVRVYAGNDRERIWHFTTKAKLGIVESVGMSVPSIERAILENLLPSGPAAKKSDPVLAIRKLHDLCERGTAKRGETFRKEIEDRFEVVADVTNTTSAMPALREALASYFNGHAFEEIRANNAFARPDEAMRNLSVKSDSGDPVNALPRMRL